MHEHAEVCDPVLQALVAQIRSLARRGSEQSNPGTRQRLYAERLRLARVPAAGNGAPVVPPSTPSWPPG